MNKTEDDELDAKELTEEEIQQVTGRAEGNHPLLFYLTTVSFKRITPGLIKKNTDSSPHKSQSQRSVLP